MNHRKDFFSEVKRVVVKVGSGVLTLDNGLNLEVIKSVSSQICALMDSGLEVLLVSSGAMSAGIRKMNLPRRPDGIPERQAIAAVGQAGLMMAYENAFHLNDRKVAQVLLTGDGLTNRKRYLNARNTLNTLLKWQVVPIINENDTVSVQEIQFGDNDNLSAMITLLMDADILINLTDIDGLYNEDPRISKDAGIIYEVTHISRSIEKMAGDIPGALGTGGMRTKIEAAKKVTAAGVPMVIASGKKKGILTRLFFGKNEGTFFIPEKERMNSRKCWIGFSLKPKGEIRLDDGAAEAMVKKGKSLLPIGIIGVEGEFGVGAPVKCRNGKRGDIGTGLVNYSAGEIRRIMGRRTEEIMDILGRKPYDEVIHRDNFALTAEEK